MPPVMTGGMPMIDWHDAGHNSHVLDWRTRAHEFLLTPVGLADEPAAAAASPARLITEEEQEAFSPLAARGRTSRVTRSGPVRQGPAGTGGSGGGDDDDEFDDDENEGLNDTEVLDDEDGETARADESDDEATSREVASAPGADADLVRVYMQRVGRRRLLTLAQEQAIGQRIEDARTDLVQELAHVPSARKTILSLAARVGEHAALEAELILLPDGGELTRERARPLLRAFAELSSLQEQIDDWYRRRGPRQSAATRARNDQRAARTADEIATRLAHLPLRPSLVDEVTTALGEVDERFRAIDREPAGRARTGTRRALEQEVGLSRTAFSRQYRTDPAAPRGPAGRQERAGRGQPPAGDLDRQALSQPGPEPARPHPGGKHRPHEGRGPVPGPGAGSSSRPTRPGGSARRSPGPSRTTGARFDCRCTSSSRSIA